MDIVNNSTPKTDTEDDKLWSTDDVMEFTGWGRTYISRLCTNGTLPHIKGKPHKFVPSEVKAAVRQMQTGGRYGKSISKGGSTMKAAVTTCPFTHTVFLADISAQGTAETEKEIEAQVKAITDAHPELKDQLNNLDDLYLQAINASQNSTLRQIICTVCNSRTVCKPKPQDDQEKQC